jgi:hypothetical protein
MSIGIALVTVGCIPSQHFDGDVITRRASVVLVTFDSARDVTALAHFPAPDSAGRRTVTGVVRITGVIAGMKGDTLVLSPLTISVRDTVRANPFAIAQRGRDESIPDLLLVTLGTDGHLREPNAHPSAAAIVVGNVLLFGPGVLRFVATMVHWFGPRK